MHRLSTSFVPGCHGCDMAVADALLAGEAFRPGENAHDRLGHGVYLWEANPKRGLDFTRVSARRAGSSIKAPAVVGAATDLSLCLGLTSSHGLDLVAAARGALTRISAANGAAMPVNSPDGLRRNLDCAVVNLLHDSLATRGEAPFDTVTGIFVEGTPMYPGLGFHARTHVQVCVRTLACIRGVFRVPAGDLA